jgi:flavin-dependent dehydrogenase
VRSLPFALGAAPQYDVLVCGGTIGIFLACALQLRGLRVAVLERAAELRGREQDWNISRKELDELIASGVLTRAELEAAIGIEFNPMRCAFAAAPDRDESTRVEVWTRDVLNVGVRPDALIRAVRARFEAAGGVVRVGTALGGLELLVDGVRAPIRPSALGSRPPADDEVVELLTARLVLDAMGNASPILAQQRHGVKPDGVCLVVGTSASGFPAECNAYGDIIATASALEFGGPEGASPMQLFWEAFPASSGPTDRTTYMFTYVDAQPGRPSLAELLESYWRLLPAYQRLPAAAEGDVEAAWAALEVQRVLFGFFPAYRASPTAPAFDRVLPVGDAGGLQSPLSFGGFGALTRHLDRVASGVERALAADALSADELGWLQPYMPNLSAPWLFQKAMSAPVGSAPGADVVNGLLRMNFRVMERLGEAVLKPFLQDVPQLGALAATIGGMMLDSPAAMPALLARMGPGAVATWSAHMAAMAAYTAADAALREPLRTLADSGALSARDRHQVLCALDAWRFGSGADYELDDASDVN